MEIDQELIFIDNNMEVGNEVDHVVRLGRDLDFGKGLFQKSAIRALKDVEEASVVKGGHFQAFSYSVAKPAWPYQSLFLGYELEKGERPKIHIVQSLPFFRLLISY